MNVEILEERILMARGKVESDIVFKNGRIVNVFSNEIIEEDIAISDGIIVGIGEGYSGKEEIDLEGKYISPGFIDGHVHIESSMVGPRQFSQAILPRGVTTIIADPHEIANVKGIEGIEYILKESEDLPLDVYVMLPSCVPATPFENSGAVLLAEDFKNLIEDERVLGLGEMMNFPGVIEGDKDVLDKLILSTEKGKIIDGHGPGISKKDLNTYVAAGVKTEHECSNIDEMLERLRLGMYIHIREGSAARNLKDLIGGVNKDNLRRCIFCTDDKHPSDLSRDGSIDHNIRLAIEAGVDPIDSIKMASLNAAECYGLKDRGALAPGYIADLVIVDDLEEFNVLEVYKKGELVGRDLKPTFNDENKRDISNMYDTVNIKKIEKKDLEIELESDLVNVIKLVPNNIFTERVERKVEVEDGKFVKANDILKLAVIERHKATGNIGLGFIEGFGLEGGAIGSTIGHDSHNMIVTGDSDDDMMIAIEELGKMGGGLVVVSDKKVLGKLPMVIGGIMSEDSLENVIEKLEELLDESRNVLGVNKEYDPFMTLSFMALPVIPEVKLTDMGLFDVNKFDFIDLEVE